MGRPILATVAIDTASLGRPVLDAEGAIPAPAWVNLPSTPRSRLSGPFGGAEACRERWGANDGDVNSTMEPARVGSEAEGRCR